MKFNSFKPIAPTNMMKVLNRIAATEASMVSCKTDKFCAVQDQKISDFNIRNIYIGYCICLMFDSRCSHPLRALTNPPNRKQGTNWKDVIFKIIST